MANEGSNVTATQAGMWRLRKKKKNNALRQNLKLIKENLCPSYQLLW